jgi:putative lipase involved disintegration of autophagic bodies
MFGIGNSGIAGKEDLSLNAREGFGENGDGCRLLVFAYDSCKGLVLLLAYASVEAFSPGGIFG